MENIVMSCGIDVGNGYVKAKTQVKDANTYTFDMPSCVTYLSAASWIPAEATDEYLADIANELDCDVMSDSVSMRDRRRIIMGRRAAASGRVPVMFDINDSRPKCDDSLSGQFVCGVIAASALRHAWDTEKNLPAMLDVTAYVALALPISDFSNNRERYRNMFVNGSHSVHVHNFDHEITVNITFGDV